MNRWSGSSRAALTVVVTLLAVACRAGTTSSFASVGPSATASAASTPEVAVPTTVGASPTPPVSSIIPSTAPSVAPTVVQLPTGMLATAPNGVSFLQWTQSDTMVTGSITEVWTTSAGAAPQHQVLDFTGVLSGNSVTITLSAGETINGTPLLTGQFSSGQFTLTFPAPDGTISTLVFVPGTVGDYNNAVALVEAGQASIAERRLEAQTSCSVQVASRDAFVEAKGTDAIAECRRVAAAVSFGDGSTWAPATAPSASLFADEGVICGGLLNGYRVIVFDTGGAYYGGTICHALPIVQATLGIRGNYQPGAAGIQIADLPDPNNSGAMLPGIVPGGPAVRAGLQDGDIITAIDGTTIYGAPLFAGENLTTILAYDSPGQTVQVMYLRAGVPATVAVTLAEVPPGQ